MNDLFSVEGKVALVTGGAQGMGRMIAEGLVKAGVRVYITSRKPDVCEQSASELCEFGECVAIPATLDTPEAVVELANRFKEKEEKIDILINNAGRTWGAPLEEFPDKAWAPVMAVNVQGPFTLIRELLPQLRKAGGNESPARVINIGSLAGMVPQHLSAYSYAASKAAIHHLSRELAADLAGDNITVNAIVPGYFPTKMTAHIREEEEKTRELVGNIPLNRLGSPEDIVGLCIFLSSRAGAYITGVELPVDGGMSGCN
jgi:NAD(P)-dependent dehydrogenase (short-subunit alcohol dehydrogenase family)